MGNIVGRVCEAERHRHMIARPGTLGRDLPRVQPFEYALPAGAAALLYRDFQRAGDDATVLVIQSRPRDADGAHKRPGP